MPESHPASADGRVISRAEVAHLARLARLAVTEDELDRFAGQLDVILASVASVGKVAADDIEPTSHAVPLTNVFRPDQIRPGLTQEQVAAKLVELEGNRPLDGIDGWGRAEAAEANRLVPADGVRQMAIIVVGAGIAAHPGDRHRGDGRAPGEQVHCRCTIL